MYKYSEHSSIKSNPFIFLLLLAGVFGGIIFAIMFKEEQMLLLIDLVIIIMSLMTLIIWFFKNKANKLMANESEILFEVGLLSKSRAEVITSSVRTVKIKQSFLERIFSIGTIEIYTSGDSAEIIARAMPNPHKFRELIKSNSV